MGFGDTASVCLKAMALAGCLVEGKGDRGKLFRLCYSKTRKPRALKLQFRELRSREAAVAPNHSKTWDPKPLETQE